MLSWFLGSNGWLRTRICFVDLVLGPVTTHFDLGPCGRLLSTHSSIGPTFYADADAQGRGGWGGAFKPLYLVP